MHSRNLDELRRAFPEAAFRNKLGNAFALCLLYRYGIRQPNYAPADELSGAITLSPAGLKVRSLFPANLGEKRSTFGVFMAFAHDELFIDLENTDIGAIVGTLHADILSGAIKYPWMCEQHTV